MNGPAPEPAVKDILENLKGKTRAQQMKILDNITLPDVPRGRPDLTVLEVGKPIDAQALSLMPDDIPASAELFPIEITPDGNCLPRAIATYLYGCEDFHLDVRLRIARELILKQDKYLQENHLSRGGVKLTATMMAMYSDYYNHQTLDANGIAEIYRMEVEQILQQSTYMGVWQLYAASDVLGLPLVSVYPKMGNPNVRTEIHRLILPEVCRFQHTMPAYIMWSSLREDMVAGWWVANHFVLLLPMNSRDTRRGSFLMFFFVKFKPQDQKFIYLKL